MNNKTGVLTEVGKKFLTEELIRICSQPGFNALKLRKIGFAVYSGSFNNLEIRGTHWSDECEIDYSEVELSPRFSAFLMNLEILADDELEEECITAYKLMNDKVMLIRWEDNIRPIRIIDSKDFPTFTFADWRK